MIYKTEFLYKSNIQGAAIINYPDKDVPFTRKIEYKHFEPYNTKLQKSQTTVIDTEYSVEWDDYKEPFFPINDEINMKLYKKYKKLADKEKNVIFGGRLAEYKYYDMDEIIEAVFKIWKY
jgi:UDP-galactopyranose mutase